MNRKKVNIIGLIILAILIVVASVLHFMGKNRAEGTIEQMVATPVKEEIVEPIGEMNDGTVIYSNDELEVNKQQVNHFDGGREKAEVKEDYTNILGAKPVIFLPSIPDKWLKNRLTQVDKIDGYYELTVEERIKLLKKRTDFSLEEKAEWEKINKVNEAMSAAFQNSDYNTYLKHMYKGWREYYGVTVGAVIKSGEFTEKIIEFYPEIMDTELGFAYGVYIREISYGVNGQVVDKELKDGLIIYKQDSAGNWEVYLEKPLPAASVKKAD